MGYIPLVRYEYPSSDGKIGRVSNPNLYADNHSLMFAVVRDDNVSLCTKVACKLCQSTQFPLQGRLFDVFLLH